ncbi:hypothetical protein [Streptomyces sp. t39]|uniref:hypothetical protein n=1 Tax=Streptomyces sp. t39 TaxID=1828156 RepID=UPI0011CD6773|nr:hypothetical protein [Streptomyces sp. t39]TXS54194.1 hypothetical protein EAO77_18465 [Streptomyces sp. t39]
MGAHGQGRDRADPLDELYATAPPSFVERRRELAARAAAAGRADDARLIRASRRPTLAAWAANLLRRADPEESERFLDLGHQLREAYRTLDSDVMRDLSARRGAVVTALAREAARLAEAAGHRLSDAAQQEVATTLRAVLADQESADRWAAGHLERSLTPPTTPAPTAAPAPDSTPRRRAPAAQEAGGGAHEDELADRRRRREELAAARRAATEADRALAARRDEDTEAAEHLETARRKTAEAEGRVEAARTELRRAQDAAKEARSEEKEAERRVRATREAVRVADRGAQAAAQALADADGPR